MPVNDVLLDLIDDNTRRIVQLLDEVEDECLHWRPDAEANSIAVTLWHASRVLDVFKTQHIDDRLSEEEMWFANGWAQKTGYDPRGKGTNGWGAVSGYSQADVDDIPRMNKTVLKGYYDEVLANVKAYVASTPEETLRLQAPGYEGKQTNYFWVRHPLFDLTRHVGEMLAIRAIWDRRQSARQP